MSRTCQIIDPTEHVHYDERLLASGKGHFFLSSAWAEVFKSAYGYQPYYWQDAPEGRIRFLLPMMEVNSYLTGKRAISLPFTDYCEPIYETESQFQAVLPELHAFAEKRGWRTIEFRGGDALLAGQPASRHYVTHQLELSADSTRLYHSLHDSTRRNIRKAERSGVQVEVSSSLQALEAFYRLNSMTRKKHGLPPQPYSFFRTIWEKIIRPGKGRIYLAQAERKTIAGAVFFDFGLHIIYKYGASDERYQALRANNLLMWKAIEHGCAHGFKTFDFGKTEPGNEGLRRFKLNWGAREKVIHYHKYHLAQSRFIVEPVRERHWSTRLFAGMPEVLLKMIGRILYAHAA